MKIRDVMSRDVIAVRAETPVKEVARLMSTYGISGLPVIDEGGAVLGVVSEADFLIKGRGPEAARASRLERVLGQTAQSKAARAKVEAATAGELMTAPALTIDADAPLRQGAALMVDRGVNRLPVTRAGQLVGIVTRADLVRAYLRPDEELRRIIQDELVLKTLWVAPETVEVEVSEGVVRLAGTLDRRSTAETLAALVGRLDGVVAVESDLRWQFDDRDVRLPEEDLLARSYRR